MDETTPERYKNSLGHDVIDLVKIFDLNFNEGNILKYILRKKNEDISDLYKIIDYANREIKYLEAIEKFKKEEEEDIPF